MSAIEQDIREKMMLVLQEEENKTDLENLSVLSKIGMKMCSSTSPEVDADTISASSTALIDLGLRLSDATAHGSLKEIILHNSSGYCILMTINDEYIVFGGLKSIYRVGYYLGYMRVLAGKLRVLISGNEITKMALSLDESERKKQEEAAESSVVTPLKPSIEQDRAALDELLSALDDWEMEGGEGTEDFGDLEVGNVKNVVSIPKATSVGLPSQSRAIGLPKAAASKPTAPFKVYDDEVPPVPLEDYTPMEIEDENLTQAPEPAEDIVPPGELPSLDKLGVPDFNASSLASEYDTKFILDEESEALDAVLKDLGWHDEDN